MPRRRVNTIPDVGDEVYLTNYGMQAFRSYTECRFATVTEPIVDGRYTQIKFRNGSVRLAIGPAYVAINPPYVSEACLEIVEAHLEIVYVEQLRNIIEDERLAESQAAAWIHNMMAITTGLAAVEQLRAMEEAAIQRLNRDREYLEAFYEIIGPNDET